jgi:hypothetical protein
VKELPQEQNTIMIIPIYQSDDNESDDNDDDDNGT